MTDRQKGIRIGLALATFIVFSVVLSALKFEGKPLTKQNLPRETPLLAIWYEENKAPGAKPDEKYLVTFTEVAGGEVMIVALATPIKPGEAFRLTADIPGKIEVFDPMERSEQW